jgi:hypothetical protein
MPGALFKVQLPVYLAFVINSWELFPVRALAAVNAEGQVT